MSSVARRAWNNELKYLPQHADKPDQTDVLPSKVNAHIASKAATVLNNGWLTLLPLLLPLEECLVS